MVTSILFIICPEKVLLDHMVVLVLISLETLILFSKMVIPIYILTNSVQEFPFSIISNICYLIDFGALIIVIYLHVLIGYLLIYLLVIFMSSYKVFQVFWSFYIELFLHYWVVWIPYKFWTLILLSDIVIPRINELLFIVLHREHFDKIHTNWRL